MQLTVFTKRGASHVWEGDAGARVQDVCEWAAEAGHVAPACRGLLWDGHVLVPSQCLRDTGLQPGAHVLVLESRRGPSFHLDASDVDSEACTQATIHEATRAAFGDSEGAGSATGGGVGAREVSAELVADVQAKLRRLTTLLFNGGHEEDPSSDSEDDEGNAGGADGGGEGQGGDGAQAGAAGEGAAEMPEVPPEAIAALVSMGFAENGVRKALLLCGMNVDAAMEWVLQHCEDADFDTPITAQQWAAVAPRAAPPAPRRRDPQAAAVNPEAVRGLREMGFAEADAHEALTAAHNDYEAAVAWLLGDRGPAMRIQAAHHARAREAPAGLEDPIIRALLVNPVIQGALTQRRVMAAFQRLIEDPSSTEDFLRDPFVGPTLLQVYQEVSQLLPDAGDGDGHESFSDIDSRSSSSNSSEE